MTATECVTSERESVAAKGTQRRGKRDAPPEVLRINKKRSWQTIRRIAMTSILKRDPRVSRPPGGLYRNYRRGARMAGAIFPVATQAPVATCFDTFFV